MKREDLPPTDTYYIAFDTKEMPGLIVATEVTIKRRLIRKSEFIEQSFRIDLVNPPSISS